MGALTTGNWIWPVVVYRSGEAEAVNLDEAFFVILALLAPPLLTLATLAVATSVAQAVRRRFLVKSAFNVGQMLIAAGLGLAVSRAIAVPSASLTVDQIGAILVGVAVYFVIDTLLVNSVVVSMGSTWREFATEVPAQLTFACRRRAGGRGACTGDPERILWAVALAVPGLVLERQLISGRFAALDDHARMAGLYEVTLVANQRPASAGDNRRHSRCGAAAAAQPASDARHRRIRARDSWRRPLTVGGQQLWLTASGQAAGRAVQRGRQRLAAAHWPRWGTAR